SGRRPGPESLRQLERSLSTRRSAARSRDCAGSPSAASGTAITRPSRNRSKTRGSIYERLQRYGRRPAPSQPTACRWPLGSGVIQTFDQAGGTARLRSRARVAGWRISVPSSSRYWKPRPGDAANIPGLPGQRVAYASSAAQRTQLEKDPQRGALRAPTLDQPDRAMKVDADVVSQQHERDSSVAGLTELSDSHRRIASTSDSRSASAAVPVWATPSMLTTYPQTSFLTVFGSVRVRPGPSAPKLLQLGRPASPASPDV